MIHISWKGGSKCKEPSVFYEELKKKFPTLKIIRGEYFNSKSQLTVECSICKYQWNTTPNLLLTQKHPCKVCFRKINNQRKSHNVFIKELQQVNPWIKVLNKYKTAHTKVECLCLKCNYQWQAEPSNLLTGFGCPKCGIQRMANKCRSTKQILINKMQQINPDIEIIGEYNNSKTKIECLCQRCNNVFWSIPSNLLKGEGCPYCNASKGERMIKLNLDKNHIQYIYQKTFKGLVGIGGKLLSYDFYLPQYNTLVEYQGRQHYEPVERFGGQSQFTIQQKHDKLKKEYALNNGFSLLEIPYYEFKNINTIINNLLHNPVTSIVI